MNYQRVACWGDSQTFGARTYGCYPLYMVKALNESTRYTWSAINLSTNGHTARDLWFRLGRELMTLSDVYRACILIGANDVANRTPLSIFAEYYRQILDALSIGGIRKVHCGEIPPLWPDGHVFFDSECAEHRASYNEVIKDLVSQEPSAVLVEFPDLTQGSFVDPAHFSELGNEIVAQNFVESIQRS